ncbi:aminoacyl tRNA synthase complex-interacting multifunctional protein 1-like isoform X2 [Macrosteles quadrilineatus]|uniref:aminoacyl tRNA synthase complex-interacting multifunctional protein 1-like isoform X2 n=1 Tax=Macrosteles quadrilineatus TaxID=74068 RepID=UPI0023E27472|nr:aminoacyl tRNA synthase complex-interacting multifunctional protein 1-like isoform X2 [Macrosteles quadrilineatus]
MSGNEPFSTPENVSSENIGNPIDEGDTAEKIKAPASETQEALPEKKVPPFSGKPRTRTPKLMDLRRLDIRVGKVRDVDLLEDLEGVYTLTIDVKTTHKRTSSTALLSAIGFDVESLVDTKVVTVLNSPVTLLPDDTECNIRVLAAVRMGGEDGKVVEVVELLKPPKKAKAGCPIYAEGYIQEQYWVIKEKNYQLIMKDLLIDKENRAVYRGIPLKAKGRDGYITTETLCDCMITHI